MFNNKKLFLNKNIIITGGTGTFGQAFVKTVLDNLKPNKLIILSRDENKQYLMAEKFSKHPKFKCLRFFIGDVRDESRLEMAMRDVDYVVHAAALKHVPVAEYNPFECIKTNVYGAENIVNAAIKTKVKKVIALSTDKAANPINLYGASKLASDKIFVAANNLTGGKTLFSVVRYGNVIGSRGSVILLYKKLIDENSSFLPITDPRMTRFWISVESGVDFVLSSMSIMLGGEIFIPKIPSAKITDIATAMGPSLKQKIIGIRNGEKLHETMINNDDARNTLTLKNKYIIIPSNEDRHFSTLTKLGAKKVKENFCYQSDKNPETLNLNQVKKILHKFLKF